MVTEGALVLTAEQLSVHVRVLHITGINGYRGGQAGAMLHTILHLMGSPVPVVTHSSLLPTIVTSLKQWGHCT